MYQNFLALYIYAYTYSKWLGLKYGSA